MLDEAALEGQNADCDGHHFWSSGEDEEARWKKRALFMHKQVVVLWYFLDCNYS